MNAYLLLNLPLVATCPTWHLNRLKNTGDEWCYTISVEVGGDGHQTHEGTFYQVSFAYFGKFCLSVHSIT